MSSCCIINMKLLLLIFFKISVTSGSSAEILTDSTNLTPCEISYTAAITLTKPNFNCTQNCIGAALNDKYILTVAECLIHENGNFKPEEIKVKAGPSQVYNRLYLDTTQHEVEKIITKDNTSHHHHLKDIALLELKSPIKFDESLSRIGLIDLIVTAPTKMGAPKWCKNKVKKSPYELHVRTGKRNCGSSRVYRGKYIIYICIKRGEKSTEYCYGAKGSPLLLSDILAGLNIAIP